MQAPRQATMPSDDAVTSCRAWTPRGLILLYNWLLRESGINFPDHLFPLVLALCDTRIKKLMMICSPGSGKSLMLSIVFPASTIGHDPTTTALCISGAENLAQGFQNTVMRMVEQPQGIFRKVFPGVRPDKGGGWSTTAGMFVTGHRAGSPDASFWAAGINSTAITGKHGSLLIFDDLHDEQNSATEEQCQNVVRKYAMQLAGRADPMGARMIMAGRRWHERDLYGTLKDNGDWVVLTLPAERPGEKTLHYDVVVPEGLDCVFTDGCCLLGDGNVTIEATNVAEVDSRSVMPETGIVLQHIKWPYGVDQKGQGFYWPESDQKRGEYFSIKRLAPAEAEAVYQCNPGAKQGSVFTEDDFRRRYEPPEGLENGPTTAAIRAFVERGAYLIQAWDTAFSAESKSDYSVCVTMLLVPCDEYHCGEDKEVFGECDPHFDVLILDVYRERLSYAGCLLAIRTMYQRWQPAIVAIEQKAYGVTAIENLEKSGIPLDPLKPGVLETKRARAVEGVRGGSVQGWCRQWRVLLPYDAPWIADFMRELKDFTGARGNTDDQVDAFVYGVRWAIQHGSAAVPMSGGWGDPQKVDGLMQEASPNAAQAAMRLDLPMLDIMDPFTGMCGRCRSFVNVIKTLKLSFDRKITTLPNDYCTLHDRMMPAIGSCDDFMDPEELSVPVV
jgi:phage terminase large subunit-like protein